MHKLFSQNKSFKLAIRILFYGNLKSLTIGINEKGLL